MDLKNQPTLIMVIILTLSMFFTGTLGDVETCSPPNSPDFTICRVGPNDQADKLNSVQRLFDSAQLVDVIFMVDVSRSTGTGGVKIALNNIATMIGYLTKMGVMYPHQCYSRVAIMSFADNIVPNINEISESIGKSLSLCDMENDIVNQHQDINWQPQGVTRIGDSLERAEQMFEQSQRKDALKVLWIYTDGRFDESGKLKNYTAPLQRLKSNSVKIITAGIGVPPHGWFECEQNERNLQELATLPELYACATNWTTFAEESTKKQESPLSAYATRPGDEDKCGDTCDGVSMCGCNMNTFQYECVPKSAMDDFHSLPCPTTTTAIPKTVTVPIYVPVVVPGGDQDGLESLPIPLWAIIVIVVGATLLLTALITACAMTVHHAKPKGMAIPPPPMLARILRDGKLAEDSEGEYGQIVEYAQKPANQEKLDKAYGDGINFTMLNFGDMAGQEDIYFVGTQAYGNVQEVKENEKHMTGWGSYLLALKDKYGLKHIAIFSMKANRAAWTPGFKLPKNDMKDIEEILNNYSTVTPPGAPKQLKLDDEYYNLAVEYMSENHIYGYLNEDGRQETAWAEKTGDYVIVGVANSSQHEECIKLVKEITDYLKALNESEYGQLGK